MDADDPRHGTNAGHLTHDRDGEPPCAACRRGRLRMKKSIALAKLRGEQLTYTTEEVLDLISPWLDMGIAIGAIVEAAGFETQRSGHLQAHIRDRHNVRRGTYRALAAVTEDSFKDTHKIDADLTRRRIYSLMAAGHRQTDIPINPKGQWRTRQRVTIGTARTIRAFFQANEATLGGHIHTMNRARNAGHRPPLAWDDPGTLAWPGGIPSPMHGTHRPRHLNLASNTHDYDENVVIRILAGDKVPATLAERLEVMRRWLAAGRSERSLCKRMGWKDGRYTERADEDDVA